jgi:hypothetical protein
MLYVDGELSDRQAAKIQRHLASCWSCRTSLAQMESTIVDFVNLRRRALDHQIDHSDTPPARASRALLAARLSESASMSKPGIWQFMRPAWIGAALAVSLALWIVAPAFFPPRVSAKELIANVEAAEKRPSPAAVVHQRVRVRGRRNKPALDTVAEYDLWTSVKRSRVMPASLRSGPGAELQAIYETHGATFSSPLSAASFAKLHESHRAPRDEVSGADFVKLTSTSTAEVAGIKSIELIVRRSDWHPITERIDLADAEYEITELLHEVIPSASLDPALFGEPAPAPEAPSLPKPIAAPEPAPILISLPTAEQLEDAEVRLREALHQSGADVRETGEIERLSGEIHLRLWTQTTSRKNEILRSLESIPYLSTEIYDAEASPGALPPVAAPRRFYSTRPPLAEALWKYLGGVDPANRYLDQVRDSYLLVLRDAGALDRLTHRYPAEQWNRLPAGLRNRLDLLAADHVGALRENIPAYRVTLSIVLDKMLDANNLPVNEAPASARPECESWREVTPDLLANLQRLQTAFSRLFVEERLDTPVTLSAGDLLRESAQSRSQLMKEFNRLCRN